MVKTNALTLLRLKRQINSNSLRYMRETVKEIFLFYTKLNVSFVDLNVFKTEDDVVVVRFIFFNENGIIEVEDNLLLMVESEITNSLFEQAFITSNSLIYMTDHYKKNPDTVVSHKWGYTLYINDPSLYKIDMLINNIRNNIISLSNDGYIGFKSSDIVLAMAKREGNYEKINGVIFIKTDKDEYQLVQSLI